MKKVIPNVSEEMQEVICKHYGIKKMSNVDADYIDKLCMWITVIFILIAVVAHYCTNLLSGALLPICGYSVILMIIVLQIYSGPSATQKKWLESIRGVFQLGQDEMISKERIYHSLKMFAVARIDAENKLKSARLNLLVEHKELLPLIGAYSRAGYDLEPAVNRCRNLGLNVDKSDLFKQAESFLKKLQ